MEGRARGPVHRASASQWGLLASSRGPGVVRARLRAWDRGFGAEGTVLGRRAGGSAQAYGIRECV